MKKVLIVLSLVMLLLLTGCVASGDSADTTQSDEATENGVTAAEEISTGEDTTEDETTDSETETEQATTEELTTERRVLTAEENLAEIHRKTYGGKVVIGGYITPADMNATETAFRYLLDGGINTMVTGNEFYGQVMITNTLHVADKLGMDIAIQTYAQIYNKNELVEKLKLSAGHKSVKYIYLCDEPLPQQFSTLAAQTKKIREAYPDDGWKIGSNMFPAGVLDEVGGWYTCSRNYIDKTSSDFLCFDFYPWRTYGDYMDIYIETVAMEKKVCDEFGTEMLSFLQTSSWDDAVLPSEGQLRFQTNVTLAMGADGMFCFTCCDSNDSHRTIIKPDGTPDEYYKTTSAVFNDVHAMKGVFLPYNTEKMIVVGDDRYYNAIGNKYGELLAAGGTYGSLTGVTGDHVIIGCMKNADGLEGFYIVNSDWRNGGTVSIQLDKAHTYQMWNEKGLEKIGTESSFTFDLVPGGACFIAIDLSLDSYDYAEPAIDDHEKTDTSHTAIEGETILDIGFADDGKIYNKSENGASLKSFCKGVYEEIDGVKSLTGYDIYTTDVIDGAKYGLTVEMYIYLQPGADKKWVKMFYDTSGNCNLHRIFEKDGRSFVGAIYLGSYSDQDTVVEDTEKVKSLLPTGEWLHIAATYSDAGQYLYVNGKLVLEGHNPNNAPGLSNFIISDPDKVCNINTARIYAYAATESQVADMYSGFNK